MATVVNKHTHTLGPGDVYIGRGSRWGNRYSHMDVPGTVKVATRDEAVEKYRAELWNQIKLGVTTLEDLAALTDKTLVCFCAPKRCHGDVLASAAEWAAAQLADALAEAEAEVDPDDPEPCEYCGGDPCYHLCPNSPHFYSPEREKEDALYNDSLSYDQWFREAVDQYERVHGEPYVS